MIPVPKFHDGDEQERVINVGLNPLWCPLPSWARAVHATCRDLELLSVTPRRASATESVPVEVEVEGLVAVEGIGCLWMFERGDMLWTEGRVAGGRWLTCDSVLGRTGAAVLRVGLQNRPLSRFGEDFTFVEQ